jgi:hypothetical protein
MQQVEYVEIEIYLNDGSYVPFEELRLRANLPILAGAKLQIS